MSKVICLECEWRGSYGELLVAKHPFDSEDNVTGCPNCKSLDSCRMCCDEKDCFVVATCGTPTDSGYRRTCGDHVPERR